ncbi:YdcF family protein [Patescibacteria group bacterium]|nr:YdcF family protein [Patescibacteria group bacterium]
MSLTLRKLFIGCSVIGLVGVSIIAQVQFMYEPNIRSFNQNLSQLEKSDAIMVLGAGILPNGVPSDALRDRLLVGIWLFQQGRADKIFITGDDGGFRTDEIRVMNQFLLDRGVPESSILIDGHGYRTYESCKNAAALNLKRIDIVTQRFHMARALYLCSSFGIEAQGITSDVQAYRKIAWFWIRDLASSLKAWWDVTVMSPKSPV